MLTGNISFLLFVRCVYGDADKNLARLFYLRCVYRSLYVFHIYPNTLSYQVAAGIDNMGPKRA